MLRVGGWLGGSKLKVHGSNRSLNALEELTQIEDAMAAVAYIMNDDVEGAEEHLSKGASPFHLLGKGVVTFMRATLGFEQEIMREAAETLSAAENAAYEHQRHAGRAPHSYQSPIYPPGTEYGVCQAQAQLMSAIVGVLNESLTEAIKSFYKLRKAFLTLEAVMDAEKKFLKERSTSSLGTAESKTSSKSSSRSASRTSSKDRTTLAPEKSKASSLTSLDKASVVADKNAARKEAAAKENDDDSDDDFVDAAEDKQDLSTPNGYMGHLGISTDSGMVDVNTVERDLNMKASTAPGLPAEAPESSVPTPIEEFEELTMTDTVREGEDASIFGDHPVDVFIISGSNFCFGILLLIISLVPPAFATLLKIVGFKGDRERGIAMLWQATKFHNIHGAMAGLVLFGFYNGLSFCDIIPQRGEGSYPKERCATLLTEMRKRHPGSHLFLLEESRVLSHEKELEKAVKSMAEASESPLKQLEALRWFERSLATMFLHNYADTVIAFQKCVTLNNWSHAMYYYICGAANVEIYRRNKSSNPQVAAEAKTSATEFFKKVVPNTGRKKFMAKQLPFDVFVTRKIQKWEQRAKDWDCDIVDAVGVSPIEEMIYFWAGFKRMKNPHLQTSLDNLAWSESSENPFWEKEGLDEKGVLALLRAAVLRCMDRTDEAKEVLKTEILVHDKGLFKGPLKDNWTAPCARYEMAACVWREAERGDRPEKERERLEECKTWLEEVARWESYDLDARTGMKITTGKATLRRYGIEC